MALRHTHRPRKDPSTWAFSQWGWMGDDQRAPLTYPRAGVNEPQTCLLIGMTDYYAGLDPVSLQVIADFASFCFDSPSSHSQ